MNKRYYSASVGGFYSDDAHTENQRPSDCVEISEKYYLSLIERQSKGSGISANEDGYPVSTIPDEKEVGLSIRIYIEAINSIAEEKYRELGLSSPGIAAEKAKTLADASKFLESGGEVPASVSAWSELIGMSNGDAARDIQAAAAADASRIDAVRAARLRGSFKIKNSKTLTELHFEFEEASRKIKEVIA